MYRSISYLYINKTQVQEEKMIRELPGTGGNRWDSPGKRLVVFLRKRGFLRKPRAFFRFSKKEFHSHLFQPSYRMLLNITKGEDHEDLHDIMLFN